MNISGSKEYICERICRTYVETGRTTRSLAQMYDTSQKTICRYLNEYASDLVDYALYKQVRNRAKQNMQEVYYLGRSENAFSDAYGSMD